MSPKIGDRTKMTSFNSLRSLISTDGKPSRPSSFLQPSYFFTRLVGIHMPVWPWLPLSWRTFVAICQVVIVAVFSVALSSRLLIAAQFTYDGLVGQRTLDVMYGLSRGGERLAMLVSWMLACRWFATGNMRAFLKTIEELNPIGKPQKLSIFSRIVITAVVVLMVLAAIGDGIVAVQRYAGVLNETVLDDGQPVHFQLDFDQSPTVHGVNESLLAPLNLGILKSFVAANGSIEERFNTLLNKRSDLWVMIDDIQYNLSSKMSILSFMLYYQCIWVVLNEFRVYNKHVILTIGTWHSDEIVMHAMIALYNRLAIMVGSADYMLRSYTTLMACTQLPLVVVNAYFIISGAASVGSIASVIEQFAQPAFLFAVCCWSPSRLYKQTSKLAAAIHGESTLTDASNFKLFMTMQSVCNRVTGDQPAITFSSLAPITQTILLTIMSALLTYVTLLLQLVK